jgi:hypothetical protein
LICPNCGRRNPAGATFCSRCRQRLPLAARYSGAGYRRAVIAEPAGGGGGGMLVLGVALLAAFLFIGGGAAIYLSAPAQAPDSNNGGLIGDLPTPGPSLDVFVQETPTADATPVPTSSLLFFTPDPGSFLPTFVIASPTPSFDLTPTPTPTPISGPSATPRATPKPTPRPTKNPTPAPTPQPSGPTANFSASREGLTVQFTNRSSGTGLSYQWDFGDGSGKAGKNPSHTYADDGTYTVSLTVTDGLGRTASRSKNVTVTKPQPTEPPATEPPPPSTAANPEGSQQP